MPELPPISDFMRDYAATAIKQARELFGVTLDYSEQSLVAVDMILGQLAKDGLIKPESLSPEEQESLWRLCKGYGAYVGEVIIRHIGATWHTKDALDGKLSVQLTVRNDLKGSPPEKVWKRLTNSEFDTIIGYYRGTQHVLGLKPFVPVLPKKPWYRKLW